MASILDYVRSLFPSVDKQNALESLNTSRKLLEGFAQSYKDASVSFAGSNFASASIKKLNLNFMSIYESTAYTGIKTKKAPNCIVATNDVLGNLQDNLNYLESALHSFFDRTVKKDAMTSKQAVLLNAVGAFEMITLYLPRLLSYVMNEEIKQYGGTHGNFDLTKYDINDLNQNLADYVHSLVLHGCDPDIYKKNVLSLPEFFIGQLNDATATVYEDRLNDCNRLTMSFSNSPIFALRVMFLNWQKYRYDLMQETRQYLSLRLAELASKQNNEPNNTAREKQMIVYKERIDKLSADMSDFERDAQDDL